MTEMTRPATWDDLIQLAKHLNAAGARYALIGGYALAAHGYNRFSEDLDILVDPSQDNTPRWIEALATLPDAAVTELRDQPDIFERSGNYAIRINDEFTIDIMPAACGHSAIHHEHRTRGSSNSSLEPRRALTHQRRHARKRQGRCHRYSAGAGEAWVNRVLLLGVPEETVSHWETGKHAVMPSHLSYWTNCTAPALLVNNFKHCARRRSRRKYGWAGERLRRGIPRVTLEQPTTPIPFAPPPA